MLGCLRSRHDQKDNLGTLKGRGYGGIYEKRGLRYGQRQAETGALCRPTECEIRSSVRKRARAGVGSHTKWCARAHPQTPARTWVLPSAPGTNAAPANFSQSTPQATLD